VSASIFHTDPFFDGIPGQTLLATAGLEEGDNNLFAKFGLVKGGEVILGFGHRG
jgi:hypothetical protein